MLDPKSKLNKHTQTTVTMSSPYIERRCPVRLTPFNIGDMIIVCEKSGEIFSETGWHSLDRCPYCGYVKGNAIPRIISPEEKKPSEISEAQLHKFSRTGILMIGIVIFVAACIVIGSAISNSNRISPSKSLTNNGGLATVYQTVAPTQQVFDQMSIGNSTSSNQPPTPTPDKGIVCNGAPPTRLRVGINGRVTFSNGLPLRIRTKPVIDKSTWIKSIPEGTGFTIIDGPLCGEGNWVWWKIRVKNDGTEGWSAEGDSSNYFMEPYN